ncbi:MAG: allantoinase, partial [Actinophytocola sp.]|nr:allantoinase [Actinophytocola sp.]
MTASGELALRSRRVVLPDGERPATVLVRGGRITAVLGHDATTPAAEVVDLGELA